MGSRSTDAMSLAAGRAQVAVSQRTRHLPLHPSASLYIPLHLSTSLCISLHPSASPSPSPSSSVGQLSHRAGSLPSCTLPETREAPAIITDAHDEVGTVPTGLPHPCQWCPIKSGDPGDRIMICVGDPSRFHVKGTVSTVGGGFFSIFFFSPFLSFPFLSSFPLARFVLGSIRARSGIYAVMDSSHGVLRMEWRGDEQGTWILWVLCILSILLFVSCLH